MSLHTRTCILKWIQPNYIYWKLIIITQSNLMLTTHIMWVSNCIIVRKEDNAILCDPNKHNIMLTHFLPKPFTQNYYSHQFFGKVYLSFNLVVDSSAFDSPHLWWNIHKIPFHMARPRPIFSVEWSMQDSIDTYLIISAGNRNAKNDRFMFVLIFGLMTAIALPSMLPNTTLISLKT